MSEPPKPEPGAAPTPDATAVVNEGTHAAPEPTPAPTAPAGNAASGTSTAAVTPGHTNTADTQQDTSEPAERETALTKKFTPAEWKALREFRKEIPGALNDAYDAKEGAKTTPIILWTVKIDPTNLVDAKTNVILMKFLRARNLNAKAAREMFVNTLRWREEFNVEAAMREDFPEDIFGKVGRIFGKDKGDRPVMYNIYGIHKDPDVIFGDVQRFLRWRVKLQEQCLAMLDYETVDQTTQIHDYLNAPSRTPAAKNASTEATNIFSSHYPETLYKKFFINVPSYFAWIFWFFKSIIPSATFAKMSVVGTGEHTLRKALLPVIAKEELPKQYGGDAEGF